MLRRIPIVVVLAATLSAVSCDEGLPAAATSLLTVELSIAPDPATAVPSTEAAFDWMTSLALIIRSGPDQSGARIASIGANVAEAVEGIAVAPVPDQEPVSFRFTPRASTNRLEPGGEAVIEYDIWYTLPGGGGEALVALNATLRSDTGGGVTDAVQVSVTP